MSTSASPEVRDIGAAHAHHRSMKVESIREVMRQWLEEVVARFTDDNNISQFARMTGIAEEDINRALNKKGRNVTLTWIAKISEGKPEGNQRFPTVGEMFAEIAERCAQYPVQLARQTQRERLLASGAIQTSTARAGRRRGRQERLTPPAVTHESKTDDRD